MSNETEKTPQQDSKLPSQGNENQGNPQQDISKKNPSQESNPQHQGQQKPEDEKRRAS
jgi:hypothetical protein